MDDAAQAFLKTKIMDNIQKYFYLICFTGYLRDQSKVAKDGITDEDKKAFSLTGGKGTYLESTLDLNFWFCASNLYYDFFHWNRPNFCNLEQNSPTNLTS